MEPNFEHNISPQENQKISKERIIEFADNLRKKISDYGNEEKVIASLGTIGTSVVLEAGRLRAFIDATISALESGDKTPGQVLKDLWGGKLIILSPEQSQKFLAGIQKVLETKPELGKFLKNPDKIE